MGGGRNIDLEALMEKWLQKYDEIKDIKIVLQDVQG